MYVCMYVLPLTYISEVAYRKPFSRRDSFDSAQRRTICSAPALLKLCRKVPRCTLALPAPLYSFLVATRSLRTLLSFAHVSWPAAYGDSGSGLFRRWRIPCVLLYLQTLKNRDACVCVCVTSTRHKPERSLMMVLLISSRAFDHSPVHS
jgi:hypothetical protein